VDLSLAEAARMLGSSERQLRYMIKTGRVKAKKHEGRWLIDSSKLPMSEGQLRMREQKAAELAQTVHEALGPHLKPPGRKLYSVRDVLAFGHVLTASRTAREKLGESNAAADALERAAVSLACGCHRFHPREKTDGFRDAREQVCAAVARLYLAGGAAAEELALGLERDVLPLLAGLLRRLERKDRP
jgi:hypothetical protein